MNADVVDQGLVRWGPKAMRQEDEASYAGH